MRSITFLLVAIVAIGMIAAPAAAQNQSDSQPPGDALMVDANTYVMDAYESNGDAVLVVWSNRSQIVTVTEAFREGHMAQKSFQLNEGQNTIRMDANADNPSGVTISTAHALRGVSIGSGLALPTSYGTPAVLVTAGVSGSVGVGVTIYLLTVVGNRMLKRRDL